MKPIGPSNDIGVEVEIRAAEIASICSRNGSWWQLKLADVDSAEAAGWIDAAFNSAMYMPSSPGEWSGWLAYQIANHDKETASG